MTMLTTPPPPGHPVRRPGAGDAAQIHELIATCDTQVLGRPDMTLRDVADELAEPGFDLGRDGWLLHGPDGRLAGWGWAYGRTPGDGEAVSVDIEVITRPGAPAAVAGWLWDAVTGRAAEIAAGYGRAEAVLGIGIYREDTAKRALAAARGLTHATSFHRLRADHVGPPRDPGELPGVTVHRGTTDEVRREGHLVHEGGFTEHFGFTPRTFEEWHAEREASAGTDWSQLLVARVHGEPAAMLLGTDHFRGRGLGRLLLRHAFAGDARRGREGTYLHVDTGNTTPALDLYLSEGMRQVLVIDAWRGTTAVGAGQA
ncbi:hypothetical protein Misp01_17050 [Microtetraspora sp. NBRC 13810]|uniref:GNAT family N-acetyltransferase n=1 Tax=Microtetraspora sp. NBRC 13810 TaxID=3030990 RepID=UPI00249FBC65|nr:GNAT family N-acetyltransferase [Microtetraspora sp. NBRC 13810]GLW06575.1 hypothetical protein Misp01_17050 [Microtetraspora sp. NBRC 13810]